MKIEDGVVRYCDVIVIVARHRVDGCRWARGAVFECLPILVDIAAFSASGIAGVKIRNRYWADI